MYIYNETSIPYVYKEGENIGLILRRVVRHNKLSTNILDTYRVKQINLLAHNSVIDNSIYVNVKNAVNSSKPVRVIKNRSILYFSKKDMAPFITGLGEGTTGTLMLTIKLFNKETNQPRRIVSVNERNVFILKGYVMNHELTLLASFVKTSEPLLITLLEGNTLIKYKFSFINNEIILDKTEEENKLGLKPAKDFRINKRVPSRPTSAILSYGKDLKDLCKIITPEKKRHHKVIDFDNRSLEAEIIKLKRDNYSAVTLYVNSTDMGIDTERIYHRAIVKLKTHFDIVIVLKSDGRIEKVKH